MKRKLLSLVLVLALVFCVMAPCALADSAKNAVFKQCKNIVKDANSEIKDLIKAAQKSKADDAYECAAACAAIAEEAIAQCAALGYEVECNMKNYKIDGHDVMIDPLNVINPPHKDTSL